MDVIEIPELYDLRLFMSGVVLEEDGVGTFLGNIDGDLEDVLIILASGCGVGGVLGIGGALCKIERRFARLASVGLTVLAPRPVACDVDMGIPGITDILFAEDEGVVVPLPFTRLGDFPAKDKDLV